MNLQEAMKIFGLNARGAKKRLAQMKSMESNESAESANSADSTDSKEEKWLTVVAKLDTYTGRWTKDGLPYTVDLEELLGTDITPEFRTKLWNKYLQHKQNESLHDALND